MFFILFSSFLSYALNVSENSSLIIYQSSIFSISKSLMAWTIISFLIFLVLLKKFVFPNLLGFIYKREDEILENYRISKKNVEETQKIKEEQKKILDKISSDIQKILKKSREDGNKIKNSYIEGALEEIEIKKKQFELEMNSVRENMNKNIHQKVISLSLEIAKELVKKNISKSENIELIKKLLDS